MKIMFHVLPTRTLLKKETWNFSQSKSSYRAGKLAFFILIDISLRKFRAVLLPRGSLGIEEKGSKFFLSPFRGLGRNSENFSKYEFRGEGASQI